MNQLRTYARDGQRAGAAVSNGVQTVCKRAARAGRQAKRARKQLAEQVPDRTAEIAGGVRKAGRTAHNALAERLLDARHELAARIEPEPRLRRRWPWMILLLLGIAGVAGAAVLTRRPQQIEPEGFPTHPAPEVTSPYSDQDATGSSPAGNGVVSAGRSSSSTD